MDGMTVDENDGDETPIFHKDRHIRYWLQCWKQLLPEFYTSNDANRMTLAFFILCALDLLGVLESKTTEKDRQGARDWIYHCQHPDGGFRAFPGTIFGEDDARTAENASWDPASLPGTFFALLNLAILGDDLAKVKWRKLLAWLGRLQWRDGSFGDVLGRDGPTGGRDIRFCYIAISLLNIARRAAKSEMDNAVGFDEKAAFEFIAASQTFEGGFARQPCNEANGGWTYCAAAAFALDRKGADRKGAGVMAKETVSWDRALLTQWLASLQISHANETHDEDGQSDYGAFAGRPNKMGDTCYSFWIGASLAMVDALNLVDIEANRRYLLGKTQHVVGGFGKCAGDPPDILHSFFGLAALSLFGKDNLKPMYPAFCMSQEAASRIS